MALIDDFKARWPQFDSTEVDIIFPSIVSLYKCFYGVDYDKTEDECEQEIIMLLLAHLFVVSNDPSDASLKTLVSSSVDGVSESYAVATGDDSQSDFFNTTKYGQMFLMLSRQSVGGFAAWV